LPPLVPAPETPQENLLHHLQGTWENPKRGAAPRQLIFEAGGILTFQNGLEFYNPGQWELDVPKQELTLTFPQVDVDKLQVFQLYLHEGVKALRPAQKQVVYHFDDQTWQLNIAGWMYSKTEKPVLQALPEEPVLH
jgi:hypothetical protein